MTDAFVSRLFDVHHHRPTLPSIPDVHAFANRILGLLFPHFATELYADQTELFSEAASIEADLQHLLHPLLPSGLADQISDQFFKSLPLLYDQLLIDAGAIVAGDPAAVGLDEVVIAYPGFYAIALYRLAHALYLEEVPFLPRLLTEYAHQQTGIDIHPGAEIAECFCIDHGTGIVIGQTAVIGRCVKMYQGVTLGAISVEKEMANQKRHPTIGDHVVIYAGATILGGDVRVGSGSVIGGNVWLTESVPPNSKVYHRSQIQVNNQSSEAVIEFYI